MQPVLPSTMVRGPAALTISFMTKADSHPWHVRWPEVKYSSSGTFLTPLNGSSCCVGRVSMASISVHLSLLLVMTAKGLFSNSDPRNERLGLAARRLEHHLAHAPHVGHGHFAAAQPADKTHHRRALGRRVHRGPHFCGQHTAEGRPPEGGGAVGNADPLSAPSLHGQQPSQALPEP